MRCSSPTLFHSQPTPFHSFVPLKPQPCFKRSVIHIIFPSNKNHISEIRKQFAWLYAVVSDLVGVAKFLAYSDIGVPCPYVIGY